MDTTQFYPTPKNLLEQITSEIKWEFVETMLEPSAGNGNIADFVKEKTNNRNYHEIDIDCIEIDPLRRNVLKGKEYRVIHDDFLTFDTQKHYDLVFMNPPFNQGDEHLLKAINMQRNGGNIICILNAETIKNTCTNRRKDLVRICEDLNASIEFIKESFVDGEKSTLVEIAVVKISIKKGEAKSFIIDNLRKGQEYKIENEIEQTKLSVNDIVKAAIQQYNFEIEAGISLLREYEAMKPMLMSTLQENKIKYATPLIEIKVCGKDLNLNKYIKATRYKYWEILFNNPKFTANMTSSQRENYKDQINELSNYDFSYYNIKEIQYEMSNNLIYGIEKCIMDLFESFTFKHSWYPECNGNIHYYNGWSTNKAWIINKKVIIPMQCYSYIWKRIDLDYKVTEKLNDIEKVFNYLQGIPDTIEDNVRNIIETAKRNENYKNIEFKYFIVSFYKKGTCHITFKNDELLKKFNIFGSRKKGWLPPSYGKKSYSDMSKEEKEVIDEFEGEKSYMMTVNNPEYYLYKPEQAILQIEKTA